jgi:hypothetical protein
MLELWPSRWVLRMLHQVPASKHFERNHLGVPDVSGIFSC